MLADRRLSALRVRMREAGVGAFLVMRPENVAYITGFEGVFDTEDAHVATVTSDSAVLYTDTRYFDTATAAAAGTAWTVRLAVGGYATACDEFDVGDVGLLAIESSVPHSRFVTMSEKYIGEVIALDQCVEQIRQVKEPEEIERIAAAQALTDQAFEHIVSRLIPGVTEWDIALELEFYMRNQGSEGVAFPPIVASGPNSAFPHAAVTKRVMCSGDFVKLDFGAKVDGYCADMTRTVVLGIADERQRAIYEAVLYANAAGTAAVFPGVPGKDVDRAAREVIESRGFGERFGHGLGHGVGMQIHELPNMGPRSSDNLPEHSVVTVEPGIYIPGFGGVRIEDLIVVEQSGARVLTGTPRDLLEL